MGNQRPLIHQPPAHQRYTAPVYLPHSTRNQNGEPVSLKPVRRPKHMKVSHRLEERIEEYHYKRMHSPDHPDYTMYLYGDAGSDYSYHGSGVGVGYKWTFFMLDLGLGLQNRGHEFTVFSVGLPNADVQKLMIANVKLVDSWEIILPRKDMKKGLALLRNFKPKSRMRIYLSKINTLDDQKEEKDFQFSHFPTHGFRRRDRQLIQNLIKMDKTGNAKAKPVMMTRSLLILPVNPQKSEFMANFRQHFPKMSSDSLLKQPAVAVVM